jgi:hypothetical protein
VLYCGGCWECFLAACEEEGRGLFDGGPMLYASHHHVRLSLARSLIHIARIGPLLAHRASSAIADEP